MFNPRTFKPTFHGVPTIKIKQKCLEDMWHLVQIVGMEVGWLVVTHETEDGDFVLSEVVLPDQNCHGATTELNEQGLADAAMRLIDEDTKAGVSAKDPGFRANHLSTWCH